MGLKEAFQRWSEKRKEEREELKRMERDIRLKKRIEQKMKTPAQKEYEFYQREKQKENLNKVLAIERKQREERMKALSDPFKKNNNAFREGNDIMNGGGIKWL